ncbi:MAG: hypothetical protein ACRBC3_19030 [Burkholderiaceae bacterium]
MTEQPPAKTETQSDIWKDDRNLRQTQLATDNSAKHGDVKKSAASAPIP